VTSLRGLVLLILPVAIAIVVVVGSIRAGSDFSQHRQALLNSGLTQTSNERRVLLRQLAQEAAAAARARDAVAHGPPARDLGDLGRGGRPWPA